MRSLFLVVLFVSGCGIYLKPSLNCEVGKRDLKNDCWVKGEVGTVIKLEDIKK